MFKKITFFAAFFSLITLAACTQDKTLVDPGQLPDVIKIGFISPLTGNAGAYGQDMKTGVAQYFKEHPTIAGKPVEMIWEDGKCNGQDAASAAQKLVNIDKVQVIIGGTCSGETLAMAPIVEQAKVAILSPGSSSPEVTTAGDYVFRVYPSDAQVGATLVDDVESQGYKKVAMLTEQTDYAQGYRGAVKARMEKYPKMTLVVDEAYAVDNTDFRTILTKVKDSGADVIISVSQTPVGHGFTVKQA
jgi:branched-chain amino acid transport system substrate-binding protein